MVPRSLGERSGPNRVWSHSARMGDCVSCRNATRVTVQHEPHSLNSDALIQEHLAVFFTVVEMKVMYFYSFLKL